MDLVPRALFCCGKFKWPGFAEMIHECRKTSLRLSQGGQRVGGPIFEPGAIPVPAAALPTLTPRSHHSSSRVES